MALVVWVMMGIALWHFTVFLPDRFWGGIVGAFVGALIGSVIFGLAVNGFTVPGQDDTDLLTAFEVPGQTSTVTAGALDGPGSQHRVLIGELHQLGVTVGGGLDGDLVEHPAGAGIDCGRGMGVDVGVDADDDIDHFTQIGHTGHAFSPLPERDVVPVRGGDSAGL